MDGAVGSRIFVVEVEGAGNVVVFEDSDGRVVEDDGVFVGGAVEGVGFADAVRGVEFDDIAEVGLEVGGCAFADVDDGAAEGNLVVLPAGYQKAGKGEKDKESLKTSGVLH